MANYIVCDYCGKKKKGINYIHVENDQIFELKSHLFFCDKHCFSAFKKSFLTKRSRAKNASIKEKLMQNPERTASNEDILNIFKTLTTAQKKEMLLHMMGICYARSDKTVKGILQIINGLQNDHQEGKRFMYTILDN